MTNEADKPASSAASTTDDEGKPLTHRMKCDAFCPWCEHGLCKHELNHPGQHECNMAPDHWWGMP